MPELPEVEIVRRGLESALLGKRLSRVVLNRPDLRVPITPGFVERISGVRVEAMIRRGKYIIVVCDNGAEFILHLGMSGRIHIYGSEDKYSPAKHDHALFYAEDKTCVVFNDPRRFGMLYLADAKGWCDELPFSAMGPEPLNNNFSGPIFHAALKKRRGPIKTVILDQKIVAGVGNIYACEALYDSVIHPETPACDLTLDQCEKLSTAIRAVLQRAIEAGGSSLKDYKQTDGTLGYFQHSFSVYDRAGQPCSAPACGCAAKGGVQRIVQAGRSTFYCPFRQKRKNKKAA